jgi:hypothetical protein
MLAPVRTLPVRSWPLVLLGVAVSCGGGSVDGRLETTASEVCLSDKRVCIAVPTDALEEPLQIRIAPTTDLPGGQIGEGYDISAVGKDSVTFLKPAKISFSLDMAEGAGVTNLNLLKLYTKGPEGDWQPLDAAFVDRVRNVITGETSHLSPFVILRSDLLPDGGLPVELDGGTRDASVIVIPPFDGGQRDAGAPDAGRPDSGTPVDAGTPDAGMPDAGMPDAGMPDAGTPDAGFDAGTPDAGMPDAGMPDAGVDAGTPDAGVDAGTPDAGVDAGEPDAGEADAGVDAGTDDAGTDAGEPDAGDGG